MLQFILFFNFLQILPTAKTDIIFYNIHFRRKKITNSNHLELYLKRVFQTGEMSNFLEEDFDALLNVKQAENQRRKLKF